MLVLVGDGPDRDAVRRAAGASVRVVGDCLDVLPWYQACDVLVQPSRWEAGAALTTREAMSCGVPVVATDLPGVAEVLGEGGGSTVAVDDAPALAAALRDYAGDAALRASDGAAGRAVAERLFDLDLTARAVDAVCASVLRP